MGKANKFVRYWRNSLADADLGQGTFNAKAAKKFISLQTEVFLEGKISEKLARQIFAQKNASVETVPVILRPYAYSYRPEHGQRKQNGIPELITPVICFLEVSRTGRLYSNNPPVIPRDLLEPLESKSFSVGHINDLDSFLGSTQCPSWEYCDEDCDEIQEELDNQWKQYRKHCQELFNSVCGDWVTETTDFDLVEECFLNEADILKGPSQHVIKIYDHILNHEPEAPLLTNYADDIPKHLHPCLRPHSRLSHRLAHASNDYSLAEAQRDALCHALEGERGEILAVNGPPGTGKTTLLLSLVATLWAKAVIDNSEPPVIIATSTNNQAVKNIINAFAKDFAQGDGPLAGRWLPGISSFGAYFPSFKEEGKMSKSYQTREFFQEIESEAYITEAEEYFLSFARKYISETSDLDVAEVTNILRNEIVALHQGLELVPVIWHENAIAWEKVRNQIGFDPDQKLKTLREKLTSVEQDLTNLNQCRSLWTDYLADEPIWLSLFSWIPPIKRKRDLLAFRFVKQKLPDQTLYPSCIEDIEKRLDRIKKVKARFSGWLKDRIKHFDQLLETAHRTTQKWNSLTTQLVGEQSSTLSLEELDFELDKHLRFQIFRLATHYWEGQWLLEMKGLLPSLQKEKTKRGRLTVEKRWRRRMKITPCIVTTLYMLPAEMIVRKPGGSDFVDDYLYNFIDLLILDEAGQILPELAGASFALAKKSIVIGDTRQIEPIRSIIPKVDIGNLINNRLISSDSVQQDYEQLSQVGLTASAGSVMQIAQKASAYQYRTEMERGMYLFEHRRCYKEIIQYCNKLCYDEKLIYKRESSPDPEGLPALGYLHIDGLCAQASGGSRFNLLEAETIAIWIDQNKTTIEEKYGKKIHEALCVITPFGRQVSMISEACSRYGIKVGKNDNELIVGTVHSIQGAERPLVIFSGVYSKHADGPFIDSKNSMLNVAVSRAKDHFLYFGDMDILSSLSTATPRGLLAKFLFESPRNKLEFPNQPRRDLAPKNRSLQQLRDAEEHDNFLINIISRSKSELHIVSPWIRWHCLENTGALAQLIAAANRNVNVTLYTDLDFNSPSSTQKQAEEQRSALFSLSDNLSKQGIELAILKRVHSKIIICDGKILCVGSFNWFSAPREGRYTRHETSLAYEGQHLKKEITTLKISLNKLRIKHFSSRSSRIEKSTELS